MPDHANNQQQIVSTILLRTQGHKYTASLTTYHLLILYQPTQKICFASSTATDNTIDTAQYQQHGK